jgi:hypothetical protein
MCHPGLFTFVAFVMSFILNKKSLFSVLKLWIVVFVFVSVSLSYLWSDEIFLWCPLLIIVLEHGIILYVCFYWTLLYIWILSYLVRFYLYMFVLVVNSYVAWSLFNMACHFPMPQSNLAYDYWISPIDFRDWFKVKGTVKLIQWLTLGLMELYWTTQTHIVIGRLIILLQHKSITHHSWILTNPSVGVTTFKTITTNYNIFLATFYKRAAICTSVF